MKEQMRAEFETWAKSEQMNVKINKCNENYVSGLTSIAFRSFKLGLERAVVPANHIGDSNEMVRPIAYKVVVTLNGETTRSTLEPRKMSDANKKFITDNGYEVIETPLYEQSQAQQPAQEPVAYLYHDANSLDDLLNNQIGDLVYSKKIVLRSARTPNCRNETPLYANPQEPVSANLKNAVATVLEGWTLPDGVRKILETAYFQEPVKQESPAARLLVLKLEIEHICDDVKYAKDAKLAIQKLDFSKYVPLPPVKGI